MRVGSGRPARGPDGAAGRGAEVNIRSHYPAAIVTGIVMSGVGAGLWFGLGAGLLCAGLLLVFVPFSATVLFVRMTLDTFGPDAERRRSPP